MSVRFTRSGTNTLITDHEQLINKGARTHAEIDSYLDELDVSRGLHEDLGTRIGLIEGKNEAQDTAITLLGNKVDANTADIDTLKIGVATNTSDISDIRTDLTSVTNELDALKTTVATNVASITNLITNVTTNTADIAVIKTRLDTRDTEIATLKTSVEANAASIATLSTDLTALSTSLNTAKTRVDDHEARIAVLETAGGGGTGETSQEVIEARTDANGFVFINLKARLDDMQGKIGSGGGGGVIDASLLHPRTVTTYTYDEDGNVIRMVVSGDINRVVDFVYEEGRVVEEVITEGGVQKRKRYKYDPDTGNVKEEMNDQADVYIFVRTGVDFHVESLPDTRPAPQRAFTIPRYAMGADSLQVYVDGVFLSRRADYIEVNDTTIEFKYDIEPKSHVIFRTSTGNDYTALEGRVKEIEQNIETAHQHYPSLADRLDAVLSSRLRQITKLNKTGSREVPYVIIVEVPETEDFIFAPLNILKFREGEELVRTLCGFNNADSTSFEVDEQIEFDGEMRLKTRYSVEVVDEGELGEGKLFSMSFDKSRFKKVEKVEVL